MAVCALQRGGEAAHHIKRAFRMDRQNRGLVHAGPAGSYDHCHLYCRGPDFFFIFLDRTAGQRIQPRSAGIQPALPPGAKVHHFAIFAVLLLLAAADVFRKHSY